MITSRRGHAWQSVLREPLFTLGAREVSETKLEVVATCGFVFLERSDELVWHAVDGAFLGEERTAPGDVVRVAPNAVSTLPEVNPSA